MSEDEALSLLCEVALTWADEYGPEWVYQQPGVDILEAVQTFRPQMAKEWQDAH